MFVINVLMKEKLMKKIIRVDFFVINKIKINLGRKKSEIKIDLIKIFKH